MFKSSLSGIMNFYCMIFGMMFYQYQSANIPTDESYQSPLNFRNVKPTKYTLDIFTEIESVSPKFWGTVLIKIQCVEETNQIGFNTVNQAINNEAVFVKPLAIASELYMQIVSQEYDHTNQRYVITLQKYLEVGKDYEVQISFSRNFTPVDYGYKLRNLEKDQSHRTRRMAYTLMSLAGARQVFPCFDQIGLKAKFKIRHSHSSSVRGFSNAKLISSIQRSQPLNWVMEEYEETEPISTFSVAFALLDFMPRLFKNPVLDMEFQIVSEDDDNNQVNYVYDLTSQIFQFYSVFFKVTYGFKKLDIIILSDISKTAGESYGLMYVSKDIVLKALRNKREKYEFTMVSGLCHMMGKQWVGLSVGMKWWVENWLHIGLQIFLQTICVNEVFPRLRHTFMDTVVVSSFIGLVNSNEMHGLNELKILGFLPDLYENMIDPTTDKAYQLVRMMNFFLGSSIFKSGISHYLKEFKFSNSSLDQVWSVFTRTMNETHQNILPIGITIQGIMEKYINQRGFPHIIVTRDNNSNIVTVKQVPFELYIMEEDENMHLEKCWIIPLSYTTPKEVEHPNDSVRHWLTCNEPLKFSIDLHVNDWIIFDPKLHVIGRINYDMQNWLLIQKSLLHPKEFSNFDVFTRVRLVSDMFGLAEEGHLPYEFVLDTMKYLEQETHYIPWKLALLEFNKIRSRSFGLNFFRAFQEYVKNILQSLFRREQFENIVEYPKENELEFLLKLAGVESACRFGVATCKTRSLELIEKWKTTQKRELLPYMIHETVQCQGIKYGNKKHWKNLWSQYTSGQLSNVRKAVLNALGCSKSNKILKKYLQSSINDPSVPKKDSIIIFKSLASNEKGYPLMLDFFFNNFKKIYNFHGNEVESINPYLETLFKFSANMEQVDQLINFGLKYKILSTKYPVLTDDFMNGLKNAVWVKKNKEQLDRYFRRVSLRKNIQKYNNIADNFLFFKI